MDIPIKSLNSSPPGQNGRHSASDIFKYIFLTENLFFIQISLKFVPKHPIDNTSALVQVMARRRTGDSHYLKQYCPSSLTHKCDIRGRWVAFTQKFISANSFERQIPGTWDYQNKGYPPKTHLKFKSCEISFAHSLFPAIWKYCTEHGSDPWFREIWD